MSEPKMTYLRQCELVDPFSKNWIKFSDALPSNYPRQIVIANRFIDEPNTPIKFRYLICDSTEYKSILGEHNMDERYTWWYPLPKVPNANRC